MRSPTLARWILIWTTLLVGLACGGNCGGFVPNRAEECRTEGKCGMRTYAAGDAITRNYVRDSSDCAQSEACTLEGRCHYAPDASKEFCVALTDLDCRQSQGCKDQGLCSVNERGSCRIEPTGCQRHDGCIERGECVYPTAQRCDEGPVECDDACRMEGACTLQDGICVATSDADCEASHFCSNGGQCVLFEDRCVTRDDSCVGSFWCENNGTCTPVRADGETGDWCYDGVGVCDTQCWARGACAFIDGHCQTDDVADCLDSVECVVAGRCSYLNGICYVGSDDCEDSMACAAFGRCTNHAGTCVDTSLPRENWFDHGGAYCTALAACWDEGACLTQDRDTCVRPEDVGLDPWRPPPWPGNRLPTYP
jgi:hypothetical protein